MYWLENWLIDVYSAVLPEGPPPFDSLAGPDFPFWQHFIKILTILSAMVGVMLLLLSLWKRLGPRYQRQPALIKVLATHYLTPKQSLILVAVGRETFLLASSANNLEVVPLARQETGVLLESLPPLLKNAEGCP